MSAQANYSIQVGVRRAGYLEYESEVMPEYSMGMIFIVTTDGRHISISLEEVVGVCVTPLNKE